MSWRVHPAAAIVRACSGPRATAQCPLDTALLWAMVHIAEAAQAGADKGAKSALLPNVAKSHVAFPEDYKGAFTKYHTINFPATRQVRYYYANKAALQAAKEGKSPEITAKIAEGRLQKYLAEISLTGQPFQQHPDKLPVGKILQAGGARATSLLRFEVGEGIEKKQENFAAEVMAQAASGPIGPPQLRAMPYLMQVVDEVKRWRGEFAFE